VIKAEFCDNPVISHTLLSVGTKMYVIVYSKILPVTHTHTHTHAHTHAQNECRVVVCVCVCVDKKLVLRNSLFFSFDPALIRVKSVVVVQKLQCWSLRGLLCQWALSDRTEMADLQGSGLGITKRDWRRP
jgi:hypothetical protein